MNNNYIPARKSLEIPDVQVHKFTRGQPVSVERSPLDIYYLPEFDAFFLLQKGFKYLLTKNTLTTIITSPNQTSHSYIFPEADGYYSLEIKNPLNQAVVLNFETILRNYSQVNYQSGPEVVPVQVQQGGKSRYLDWTKQASKASNYLKDGGEAFKFKLLKATDRTNKGAENIDPNQITEKSIGQLKENFNGSQMVYGLPPNEINYLFAKNSELQALTQSQFGKTQQVVNSNNPQVTPWNELKKATLDSALNVWQGVEGGAANLWKGITTKGFKRKSDKNAQYQQEYNPTPLTTVTTLSPSSIDRQNAQPTFQHIEVHHTVPDPVQYQQEYHPTPLNTATTVPQPQNVQQNFQLIEVHHTVPHPVPQTIQTTATVEESVVQVGNGLYPHLSGPYVYKKSTTIIENNGLDNIPFAPSQEFVKPQYPYVQK